MRAFLVMLGLVAAVAPAWGQATPPRIRIVVHRFTTTPNDSSHRVLADDLGRLLVRALVADPAFQVMTGTRGPAGRGTDAQYAVIGSLVDLAGAGRVDIRVVDIAKVELVLKASVPIGGAPIALSVTAGVQRLAEQIHARLVVGGAP